ncbi:MAG: non-canonical purine NTP pyrophosphatase [Spirochaetaceae bacterium]
MRLILATNNDHKRRELEGILADHELLLPADLGIRFSHDETGKTFHDNALGKAGALFRMVTDLDGAAVRGAGAVRGAAAGGAAAAGIIADDSGLSVAALGGRPGVYSARYGSEPGGPDLSDSERNALLLAELEGITDRRAHYTCSMALLLEPDRYYICQETWHGEIALAPSDGRHGFGYDPIFTLPEEGLTVAEIAPERKNRISHRGKAARDLSSILAALEAEGRLDAGGGSA